MKEFEHGHTDVLFAVCMQGPSFAIYECVGCGMRMVVFAANYCVTNNVLYTELEGLRTLPQSKLARAWGILRGKA